ncbi:hypothetical protein [Mycobacterium colombiense]|uniref:hypothetical protein n=1 Tax=Mycobacterium colombiense TaxID=339268 RepID=UPI0015BFF158|nr:hypothetical protein [Mycobacterium colombiense]
MISTFTARQHNSIEAIALQLRLPCQRRIALLDNGFRGYRTATTIFERPRQSGGLTIDTRLGAANE